MTLFKDTKSEQNMTTAKVLANSIVPLFEISDEHENIWWLWFDFISEMQAQLMIVNNSNNDDGFAFRCAENFRALRQMLGVLANNKVTLPQIQEMANKLQEIKPQLPEPKNELPPNR